MLDYLRRAVTLIISTAMYMVNLNIDTITKSKLHLYILADIQKFDTNYEYT